MVMPEMILGGVLGTGTGTGEVRSFCTGRWGSPAIVRGRRRQRPGNATLNRKSGRGENVR
jgi:hypothetical protein